MWLHVINFQTNKCCKQTTQVSKVIRANNWMLKLYALVGAFSANLTADCFECRISICLSCTWANLATAFTVNHQCLHEKDHCLHSVRFMKMHTVLMRTLRVLKLYLKGRPLQSLCKRIGVFFQLFLNFFQVVFICAVVVCHTRWTVNTWLGK